MSNENTELVIPTPLPDNHQFKTLSVDQKLEALYALQLDNQQKINGAIELMNEVGGQVGPIMESLAANPMFKMLGIGKRL